MKDLKSFGAVLLVMVFVSLSTTGCTKGAIILPSDTAGMTKFDPRLATQWGVGLITESPIYDKGGMTERFQIYPNHNEPQTLIVKIMVLGDPQIKTRTATVVQSPESWWARFNWRWASTPHYSPKLYVQYPLEVSVCFDQSTGTPNWYVKL